VTVSGNWAGAAAPAHPGAVPRPHPEGEVITPDVGFRGREVSDDTDGEPHVPGGGSAEPAPGEAAAVSGDRRNGRLARFVKRFHPPDICGDRPGLAKLFAYARYGAGAPADGPLRTIQIWWFRLVCRPVTASAYWKAWALERPLRGTPVLIVQIGWWLLNIVTLIRLW
jgi:hypothetical protein